MIKVSAEWSGKWPCLCCGEWTLIVNGIDVSDKIPDALRTSSMNTYGYYVRRRLTTKGVCQEEYHDGMECSEWTIDNKDWLDTISTDLGVQEDIFYEFQEKDFRRGSCGGCI